MDIAPEVGKLQTPRKLKGPREKEGSRRGFRFRFRASQTVRALDRPAPTRGPSGLSSFFSVPPITSLEFGVFHFPLPERFARVASVTWDPTESFRLSRNDAVDREAMGAGCIDPGSKETPNSKEVGSAKVVRRKVGGSAGVDQRPSRKAPLFTDRLPPADCPAFRSFSAASLPTSLEFGVFHFGNDSLSCPFPPGLTAAVCAGRGRAFRRHGRGRRVNRRRRACGRAPRCGPFPRGGRPA